MRVSATAPKTPFDDYKLVNQVQALRTSGKSIREITASVGASPTTVET